MQGRREGLGVVTVLVVGRGCLSSQRLRCPPLSHACPCSYHCLPAPAQIMREGTDVTLVAFGKMVGYNLKAAEVLEKEGISAEVINLRSLKPIDRDAIAASVRKTHNLVSVEEGWPQHGLGAGAWAVWCGVL